MSKFVTVLVLNDGETWQTLGGQSLCVIDEDQHLDLLNGRIGANDLKPVMEITLSDVTP